MLSLTYSLLCQCVTMSNVKGLFNIYVNHVAVMWFLLSLCDSLLVDNISGELEAAVQEVEAEVDPEEL